MAAACALPGPARAQAEAAWYRGSFSSVFEQMRVTVTCESARACEYTVSPVDAAAEPIARRPAGDVAPVDVMIPNNNLAHTRDAVRADPALYQGHEGDALAAVRPLLDGEARYRHCVGSSDAEWGLLCQLDTVAPGLPDALLLLPTMNPTCNGQAFCAYFFVPLHRKPGD
ncbi:hypothetical protein ACG04Q_00045 [Roseateles sp. DXS20W]|uniref:Uncharacterized protein n=1 Tax=Pelomonas lactea TaxID=3299030 RepID=A0ABW7GDA3_9BURK